MKVVGRRVASEVEGAEGAAVANGRTEVRASCFIGICERQYWAALDGAMMETLDSCAGSEGRDRGGGDAVAVQTSVDVGLGDRDHVQNSYPQRLPKVYSSFNLMGLARGFAEPLFCGLRANI